jgi:phosphatidylinositol alpha-1,6-mannosyltransferase
MKTLVISEVFPPRTGGSGRWLWELYSRWRRDDLRILAGECAGDSAFDLTHHLPIQRLPLSFESWGLVGYRNVRQYTATYRQVAAVVKREGSTEIHCGRMLPEGLIAWMVSMRHHVPYACYVHGEELNSAGTSRELTFLARRVLKGARVLIANSLNTARVLMNQWQVPASRIEILNPGCDTQRFTPSPRDPAVRAKLGWGQRRVILTVGRLQARKGQARMIAALPRIIESVPDALYAIIGEGETRSELEALVARLRLENHVQFLCERREEELLACYQQCDLFALPNVTVQGDFEGFGMVLVEAQACGRPVIAGRSGGTGETMREGETGRLVDCENEGALAATAAELLSDESLRHRMGEAGRRWVERRFDWSVLAKQARTICAERFGRAAGRMAA